MTDFIADLASSNGSQDPAKTGKSGDKNRSLSDQRNKIQAYFNKKSDNAVNSANQNGSEEVHTPQTVGGGSFNFGSAVRDNTKRLQRDKSNSQIDYKA